MQFSNVFLLTLRRYDFTMLTDVQLGNSGVETILSNRLETYTRILIAMVTLWLLLLLFSRFPRSRPVVPTRKS